MVRVSSPAKLRPWSELTAQNGDGGGSCVGDQYHPNGNGCYFNRGQKINANFFCTKFFENPSGHGRLHRKSWTSAPKNVFFCGPGDG